ncbi:MAG: hypothetical protein RL564_301, partial [Pseudomonadota bacterium]
MKFILRAALSISLVVLGGSAFAGGEVKKGYLVDSQNDVVRSGFGLCWHTGFWTPADAIEECDGAIAKPAAAPAPAPSPSPAPAQKLAAEPEPDEVVYAEEETVIAEDEPAMPVVAPAAAAAPAPTAEKVTFSADAFFDFDKSVLKPEGKTTLQNLVAQ